ncbi:MAG: hypothetical protein MJE77_44305 [Proteobacteria bacterium]|nr:hypothetical protein [Pseudomonadota bacterium]
MNTSRPIRAAVLRYGLLALCGVVLVWHSLQYNFITDDAYISFVYARNLAEQGALVFNPGDPVEGYTNFLWTLILGLLMIVGLSPEVTSLVLGTGFGLATLGVAFALVETVATAPARASSGPGFRPACARLSPWPYVAPAVLALSAGFACWSSGGLETQMFTFWVTLALYAHVRGRTDRRWLRATGVIVALAAMTRPEGLLVAGLIGLHRLASNVLGQKRWRPSPDELICLAGFLALWAPWYAWRWWYYGYPFPNTYYVKAAGEPPPGYLARLHANGLYYVWQWARHSGAVHVAPILVAGTVIARPSSQRFWFGILALSLALSYLVYTVSVGGDFMGLHRFVMPVFVLAAVALALGLRVLISLVPAGRARSIAAIAVCLAAIAGHGTRQIALTAESMRWGNWKSDRGIDTPAFLAVYARDRAAIGEHMRSCFKDDDLSIVGGAGAQPYRGRMRAIDVFGLVSRQIAHEVQPSNPRPGHNKWAPDRMLLAHHPEFVFSCYSIHRHPEQPRFNCRPGFWQRNGYEIVTLHIAELRQQGQYYSFFKRTDREFSCPGIVK